MSFITYVAVDPNLRGATVVWGQYSQTFDIVANLNAGGGQFTIDDSSLDGSLLRDSLDSSPAVRRSGVSLTTPIIANRVAGVNAVGLGVAGEVLVSQGPTQPAIWGAAGGPAGGFSGDVVAQLGNPPQSALGAVGPGGASGVRLGTAILYFDGSVLHTAGAIKTDTGITFSDGTTLSTASGLSGNPAGPVGGDLSGTLPNPTVTSLGGVPLVGYINPNNVALSPGTTTRNTVQPLLATVPALILRGAASQSADMIQAQSNTGGVMMSVNNAGIVTVLRAGTFSTAFQASVTGEAFPRVAFRTADILLGGGAATSDLILDRPAAGNLRVTGTAGAVATLLSVRQVASQSTDMVQLQDSAAVSQLSVASNFDLVGAQGRLALKSFASGAYLQAAANKNAGLLSAGQVATWFWDDANQRLRGASVPIHVGGNPQTAWDVSFTMPPKTDATRPGFFYSNNQLAHTANQSANFPGMELDTTVTAASTANFTGNLSAITMQPSHGGSGIVSNFICFNALLLNNGTGTITNAYGLRAGFSNNTATGQITNAFGMYVVAPVNVLGGTVVNNTGLYIENQVLGGTTSFAIQSQGGSVLLKTGSDTTVGLILRGNSATQSGDALQVQSSAAAVVASISATGQALFNAGIKFSDGSVQTTAAGGVSLAGQDTRFGSGGDLRSIGANHAAIRSNFNPTTGFLLDTTQAMWHLAIGDLTNDRIGFYRAPATTGAPSNVLLASITNTGRGIFGGGLNFTVGNSSYIADGVWGGVAVPSVMNTPGSAKLYLGYHDNGSGQYMPSLGFGADSSAGATDSYYILQTRTAFGTGAQSNNRYSITFDGTHWWGPGSAALDSSLGRDSSANLNFKAGGVLNYFAGGSSNNPVWMARDTRGVGWNVLNIAAPMPPTDGTQYRVFSIFQNSVLTAGSGGSSANDNLGDRALFAVEFGGVEWRVNGFTQAILYLNKGEILGVRNIQGGYSVGSGAPYNNEQNLDFSAGAGPSGGAAIGNCTFNYANGGGVEMWNGAGTLLFSVNRTTDYHSGNNQVICHQALYTHSDPGIYVGGADHPGNSPKLYWADANSVGVYNAAETALGNLYAAYAGPPSDIRLKKNVGSIDDALKLITQMRGVMYHWRNQDDKAPKTFGFVAQEVQAILPELIIEQEGVTDGYLAVDVPRIVPLLLEAIKQLDTTNTGLRAFLKKLEARINALENPHKTAKEK